MGDLEQRTDEAITYDLLYDGFTKAYGTNIGSDTRGALIEVSGLIGSGDVDGFIAEYKSQRRGFTRVRQGDEIIQAGIIKCAAHAYLRKKASESALAHEQILQVPLITNS